MVNPMPSLKPIMWIVLLQRPCISPGLGPAWLTEISIRANWAMGCLHECPLHFLCFWSIVIHYQDLSATLFLFVSSEAAQAKTHFVLASSFLGESLCIFDCWIARAVKFNYRISLNTEGNYGAGLIAANSPSCLWISHAAVAHIVLGHSGNHIQPHNYLKSLWCPLPTSQGFLVKLLITIFSGGRRCVFFIY